MLKTHFSLRNGFLHWLFTSCLKSYQLCTILHFLLAFFVILISLFYTYFFRVFFFFVLPPSPSSHKHNNTDLNQNINVTSLLKLTRTNGRKLNTFHCEKKNVLKKVTLKKTFLWTHIHLLRTNESPCCDNLLFSSQI